jgi:hypothetical protein
VAGGLFVAAEIAWAFVARLISSCPVFLLLSGVLRGRHGDRRRRVRHAGGHVEVRHGLLHRRGAEVVHIGYMRVLHVVGGWCYRACSAVRRSAVSAQARCRPKSRRLRVRLMSPRTVVAVADYRGCLVAASCSKLRLFAIRCTGRIVT